MSKNALKSIAVFALLCMSTVSVFAQPAATAAQKFSLRNALGETITLTAAPSGVTPHVLTFPSTLGGVGQVLTLTSTTGGLSWTTAASGTVTNFSSGNLSPLFTTNVTNPTSTPALSFTLSSQAQNTVFAAPTGGAGAPSFRLLDASDIPALPYVSSVAVGNFSPLFTTTNAGTALAPSFTFAPVSQAANLVYASPNGAPGNPTFRALTGADVTGAALSEVDDANVTLSLTGAPGTALLNATTITAGWNGLLSIARGGTNSSATPTNGGVAYGDGTAYQFTTAGTSGYVLRSNGAAAPSWVDPSSFITGSALTEVDDANVTITLGGTPGTALLQPVSITAGWSGVLSTVRGGTGLSTIGTAGQVLTVNGTATGLEYTTPTNGTVTSVGLSMPTSIFDVTGSPITSSGAFGVTLDNQSGNTVFASPADGSSGTPTFRGLVAADIPALSYVSSVAVGNLSPLFTTTNSGTALAPSFTFAPVSQAANLVYASPNGGPGNPTFRALTGADVTGAALTESDDANVQLTLTGTPGSALLQSVNIAAGWSGVLSTARGGTGLSTIGTAGQVLAVNAGATGLEYVTAATGTVTNFSAGDLSPLFTTSEATTTTTPALSFNLNSQSGNTVFASPADGSSGAPLFRSLVAADVPALPYVSSVGLALPGSVFSISGSPVTGTGTLTGSFVSQAANTVFAAPDGSAGVPSFRALTGSDITGSALTTTDDANVTLTLGGSPATALLNAASITAGWTGQLSIARGGTGASTAPAALNNLLPSQAGNAGEFLTTDGAGNVSWSIVTAANAWNITGNPGTTAGTNFIGTTDNVDFVVKTNGTEALRVDATGQTGFGRATPEAKIDLDGGLIWRPDTVSLLIGATHSGGANIRHDNVSIGDRAYIYIYDTASHYGNRITGFTDGVNGKLLRIFNSTNTTLTMVVDDANSSAANRIRNSIGDNGNVGVSDSGFVDLIYDGETQKWIIHSVSGPTSTAASGFTYFARKTADQTLTDASHGTTLQNATGMTINIFPDIVHTCDGMFYFSSTNSNVDVQIAFELTGGTADLSKITLLGHSDGGANVVDGSDIVQTNGVASATINVSGGTEMFVHVSGMFINGPSNATLQVKIKRAGGSQDLVMKQGSYLRLIPVGVD